MTLKFRQSFQISKTKLSERLNSTCGQKCRKWDKRIASAFGLLSFCMLLGIVMFDTIKINCYLADCSTPRNNSRQIYQTFKSKCSIKQSCTVDCSEINENEKSIAEHIEAALNSEESKNCASVNCLRIANSMFNQSQLHYGWLANIKPTVVELKIESCILANINSRAFADHPFGDSLNQLIFENTNVDVLQRESFLGLNSITSFAFRFSQGYPRLVIEEEALDGIRGTLEILQFNYCSLEPQDIQNLVGESAAYLTRLLTLDLTAIKLNQLYAHSFISVPFLQALHLKRIGLEKIYEGAFDGIRNIHTLDLNGNALETLPKNAFAGFTKLKAGSITLANNRWKCDCYLEWLKGFYYETIYINKNDPPLCSNDKQFEEVNFCPDGSTNSSKGTSSSLPISTTTETTSEVTTPGSSAVNYITMSCRNQKLSPDVIPDRAQIAAVHAVDIKIKDEIVSLQLQELDGDPLRVIMRASKDLSNYHLLWFNTNNKNENGCITPVLDNKAIEGLNRRIAYTFSLLLHNETEVSPKCTFCVKTEPEWEFQTWIPNKYQIVVIAVTITVLIFVAGLAACITFICMRRHPNVTSNNKNGILVRPYKYTREDHLARKEYDQPTYWEPSLVSPSQGYLTPKHSRYDKIKYRPPLMRSISESVIVNANDQYNYADPRNLNQIRALRPPKKNSEIARMRSFEDYRPPLPPPNPGSKTSRREDAEELYSAT